MLLIFVLSANATKADDSSAYDRVMAKNEITCGVFQWPPYKMIDPNTKEWSGFAIDIYRKIFATLDIKVKFKELVLGTQVQDLNNGNIDAICDDVPYTLSAGKFVEFSNPVYATPEYLYARKGETRFKSRADLNSKDITFTGIDGDVSNDLATRLFPNAKLQSMPGTTDVSQLFLNVSSKKADVMVGDPSAFSQYEKTNPGKLEILFKDKPVGIYKIVISVKKGDVKMLGLANEAIDNGLALGIVDEILNGFDPKHDKLMRVRSRYER
jgi:lysine/arginine/ornithine transport system substrate-binding protein